MEPLQQRPQAPNQTAQQILPAGFPSPSGGGHDGKFGVEVHSTLPRVPAQQPPATRAPASSGSGQSHAAEWRRSNGLLSRIYVVSVVATSIYWAPGVGQALCVYDLI